MSSAARRLSARGLGGRAWSGRRSHQVPVAGAECRHLGHRALWYGPPTRLGRDGETLFFCANGCRDQYQREQHDHSANIPPKGITAMEKRE